jgi:hypothetical protein
MASVIEAKVDSSRVQVRLDAIPDTLRTNLRSIVQTLDSELVTRVQSNIPVKTGALRSAIRGHVRSSKTRVSGTVNVDKSAKGQRGIAAILESGADVPAHEELPDIKKAMMFLGGSVGQLFAASVQHPADHVPALHMFRDALASMQSEIVGEISQTAKQSVE